MLDPDSLAPPAIPDVFTEWFSGQGWGVREYQAAMVDAFAQGLDTLLIAPTGGGKTLAGFLPSLIDLHERKTPDSEPQLHTLYISPLRALTNDIARNLERPIAEMNLPISLGARTGDTSQYQRKKMRLVAPDILLTTPESLMILLSYPDAADYFGGLECVVIDELHSFATNKRGDFTSLALARLRSLAPGHVRFGLSATIAEPDKAAGWLGGSGKSAELIVAKGDAPPEVEIMVGEGRIPLGGHSSRYATEDIYKVIKANRSVIVFVNTRAQTELLFRELWLANEDGLPIGIYHGSLDRGQRAKTEALIATGKMRAVVSTSALEMGIDWGDIDVILQVGAPKGISRLMQRIGRSNHRLDEASRAILVPTNPLEAVECKVAIEAIAAGQRDGEDYTDGALDVAVQYIINRACAGRVRKRELLAEIRSAWPYRNLERADFDALLSFAVDGGYALKTYERFARLKETSRGFTIASEFHARRHRMNIGTIVEYGKMKVRRISGPKSKRGRTIGEIEERFVMNLTPGDTFIFAGEVLAYQGVRDGAVEASPAPKSKPPKVPAYAGGAMPLSTYLADGVRRTLSDPAEWMHLPPQIQDWLELQGLFSNLPEAEGCLVEGFFDRKVHVMVIHTFEGRKVNQTLGLLMTRRMETQRLKPLTFSITDYALTITSIEPVNDVRALLSEDIVAEEFEDWLMDSPMIRKSFRLIATIAGLTEQRLPGQKRTMKQMTFSTDLIYDVLRQYQPDHILLKVARQQAEKEHLDLARLQRWLEENADRIQYRTLPHASPLSIPSMMQLGKERIRGEGERELLLGDLAGDMALDPGERMLDTVEAYVEMEAAKLRADELDAGLADG